MNKILKSGLIRILETVINSEWVSADDLRKIANQIDDYVYDKYGNEIDEYDK